MFKDGVAVFGHLAWKISLNLYAGKQLIEGNLTYTGF